MDLGITETSEPESIKKSISVLGSCIKRRRDEVNKELLVAVVPTTEFSLGSIQKNKAVYIWKPCQHI